MALSRTIFSLEIIIDQGEPEWEKRFVDAKIDGRSVTVEELRMFVLRINQPNLTEHARRT